MATEAIPRKETAEEALAYHIRQYVPDAEGDDLKHRITLLKARDYCAALRGRTTSHLANDLACRAHEVSGAVVFRAGETPARLSMAADLCRRLVGAALAADGLNSDEWPL